MQSNQEAFFIVPDALPSHPAKYTEILLPVMAGMLRGKKRILDPFGGVGGIFKLNNWLPDAQIEAVEIEPEWAAKHARTTLGNALHLPWPDGYFDAIATSPVYGNRLSDPTLNTDKSTRIAYTANLGRKLHADNAGAMQWGPRYREFHRRAWAEAKRVLIDDGVFVLNIKDHISAGEIVHVTDWHIECLVGLGFHLAEHIKIETPSFRKGLNRDARVPCESVVLFTLTDLEAARRKA